VQQSAEHDFKRHGLQVGGDWEIQSSNALKVWQRIQSLENANGRSVTLPMGSDKEFLRFVEP
jgi:hypothetical protein